MKTKWVAVLGLWLTLCAAGAWAGDAPPPEQFPGAHSSVSLRDGSIRDDELARLICEYIPTVAGVRQVHDVKIFTQTCHGGGLLDDLGREFGPGGLCAGVPWVAGAATGAAGLAWAPRDAWIGESTLGSYWTNTLYYQMAREGGPGDTVAHDIQLTNQNDPLNAANTTFPVHEDPVFASGNGGAGLRWNDASKHQVVILGGQNDSKAYGNDMRNMMFAFDDLFGAGADIWMGDPAGSTREELETLLANAGGRLDPDTQLALYITDHGDWDLDVDEWWEAFAGQPIIASPLFGWLGATVVEPGWVEGLSATAREPGVTPAPCFTIQPAAGLDLHAAEWAILFNFQPLAFPPLIPGGTSVDVPVDWTHILPGLNTIQIVPVGAPMDILQLDNLELCSGPITALVDPGLVPEPRALSLLLLATLLRRRRRR